MANMNIHIYSDSKVVYAIPPLTHVHTGLALHTLELRTIALLLKKIRGNTTIVLRAGCQCQYDTHISVLISKQYKIANIQDIKNMDLSSNFQMSPNNHLGDQVKFFYLSST